MHALSELRRVEAERELKESSDSLAPISVFVETKQNSTCLMQIRSRRFVLSGVWPTSTFALCSRVHTTSTSCIYAVSIEIYRVMCRRNGNFQCAADNKQLAASLFVLLNTYLHMKNLSSGEDWWQLRWIEAGLQLFTCRWWPLHDNYFPTNAKKRDKWRETKAAFCGFAAAIIPESAFRMESLTDSAWQLSSFLLFVAFYFSRIK